MRFCAIRELGKQCADPLFNTEVGGMLPGPKPKQAPKLFAHRIDLGFSCALSSVDAAIFQKEGHGDKTTAALRRAIQNLRTQIDGLNPQDRERQGTVVLNPIEMIIDGLWLPTSVGEDRYIGYRVDFFMRGKQSKS